jgi:hypothetical protein
MYVNRRCNFRRQKCEKEAEKTLKYKDCTTEIQHMWDVKREATRVITGTTGTISKSFRKYLSHIWGKHKIK